MISFFNQIDTNLLLFLNGIHFQWADQFMFLVSGKWIWTPFYVWLIYLIIRTHGKRSAIVLVMIAIVLVLTDQVASHLIKNLAERLRPSHEPGLEGILHLVNGYKGGHFGFVSSHASNSFGIATYFFLLFRKRYRWLPWLMFSLAILVSYSRIYLGVHYPGDVICGAFTGAIIANIIFFFQTRFFDEKPVEADPGKNESIIPG